MKPYYVNIQMKHCVTIIFEWNLFGTTFTIKYVVQTKSWMNFLNPLYDHFNQTSSALVLHYTSPPSPPSISTVTGGLQHILVGVLLIKAIWQQIIKRTSLVLTVTYRWGVQTINQQSPWFSQTEIWLSVSDSLSAALPTIMRSKSISGWPIQDGHHDRGTEVSGCGQRG